MQKTPTQRALVLGATGHIGNAIVRELLAQDWQVTATSRQVEPTANLNSLPVNFVSGTPASQASYQHWFEGHQLIVDAATPYPIHLFDFSGENRTPMEVAADRTKTLLRAAADVGAAFSCVSSFTTIYEQSSSGFSGLAQHPYFGVKRAIERCVLEAWEKGFDAMMINPTLCLGPWDIKPVDLTMLPYLINSDQQLALDHMVNIVDVRDVASMLLKAYQNRMFGRRLMCAGHNVSLQELATRARTLMGTSAPNQTTLTGSTTLGVVGALFGEALFASLGRNSPFPALSLMLVQRHQVFTVGKEQHQLGVLPKPLDATLSDSLAWYRKIGYC